MVIPVFVPGVCSVSSFFIHPLGPDSHPAFMYICFFFLLFFRCIIYMIVYIRFVCLFLFPFMGILVFHSFHSLSWGTRLPFFYRISFLYCPAFSICCLFRPWLLSFFCHVSFIIYVTRPFLPCFIPFLCTFGRSLLVILSFYTAIYIGFYLYRVCLPVSVLDSFSCIG